MYLTSKVDTPTCVNDDVDEFVLAFLITLAIKEVNEMAGKTLLTCLL